MKKKYEKHYEQEITFLEKSIFVSLLIAVFTFVFGFTGGNGLSKSFYFSAFIFFGCFGFGCQLSISKFKSRYYEQHPEKYYGGNVYRVDLSSIKPEITVYNDRPRSSNIYRAQRQVVDTLLVQLTSSENYYREIITGYLVPISRVKYVESETKTVDYYYNFNSYLFVYRSWREDSYTGCFYGFCENSKKTVTSEEVEQYIQERKNGYKGFTSFEDYLNALYKQAEGYYKKAEQKAEISDDKKIQEILKTI